MAEQEEIWFIIANTSSILSILLGIIGLITFSRTYKNKTKDLYIFRLFVTLVLLLWVLYINSKFTEYIRNNSSKFNEWQHLPIGIYMINILYILYNAYLLWKNMIK